MLIYSGQEHNPCLWRRSSSVKRKLGADAFFNQSDLLFNDMLQLQECQCTSDVIHCPPTSPYSDSGQQSRGTLSVGAHSEGPQACGIIMSLVRRVGAMVLMHPTIPHGVSQMYVIVAVSQPTRKQYISHPSASHSFHLLYPCIGIMFLCNQNQNWLFLLAE